MENRIYKCISKNGPETSLMASYFTIGQTYIEAEIDWLGGNQVTDDTLLLESDFYTEDSYPVPMYIDKEDFELVRIRTQISLN